MSLKDLGTFYRFAISNNVRTPGFSRLCCSSYTQTRYAAREVLENWIFFMRMQIFFFYVNSKQNKLE